MNRIVGLVHFIGRQVPTLYVGQITKTRLTPSDIKEREGRGRMIKQNVEDIDHQHSFIGLSNCIVKVNELITKFADIDPSHLTT